MGEEVRKLKKAIGKLNIVYIPAIGALSRGRALILKKLIPSLTQFINHSLS